MTILVASAPLLEGKGVSSVALPMTNPLPRTVRKLRNTGGNLAFF